ncbi:hypothetical protein ACE1ET_13660 [Saccharicrinis sp. FJH62]|uniref:hypothetical protein n=1 Tax=Saccharicrinis sp. FJH62 TaxID=3344657 RepID=UPI0035D406C4
MKKITLLTLVVLISSCSTLKSVYSPSLTEKDKNDWNLMTGKWYGSEISQDGSKLEWLTDRSVDGLYTINFKLTKPNGKMFKQSENGEWGISGGVYFSIYKILLKDGIAEVQNATNPHNRDTYKVLKLNEKEFVYKNFRTGIKYKVIKVDSTFELN